VALADAESSEEESVDEESTVSSLTVASVSVAMTDDAVVVVVPTPLPATATTPQLPARSAAALAPTHGLTLSARRVRQIKRS